VRGIGLEARPSPFRRNTLACTGIEFCKLAIVETKATAAAAITELERRLAEAGDQAVGVVRNPDHVADVEATGAQAVVLDLEHADLDALAEVVQGADAVVFAAGGGASSGAARKETVDKGAAVLLAALGIYGVISYSVAQRTRELGIRLALGARQSAIVQLVLGQGFALTLTGVVIGLAAAFWLTRAISGLLFGVAAADPATFAGVAVGLLGIACLASYLPARRAALVDPVVAMRAE